MDELADNELMIARGRYATVRSEHESLKAELAILCRRLSSSSQQILKRMQPNDGASSLPIDELIEDCMLAVKDIDATAGAIRSIEKQRFELKAVAWNNQTKNKPRKTEQ